MSKKKCCPNCGHPDLYLQSPHYINWNQLKRGIVFDMRCFGDCNKDYLWNCKTGTIKERK